MTLTDRYGLPVTTTSATAVDHYADGVDRLLAIDTGVEEALGAALGADEGLALAHAALGLHRALEGRAEEAAFSVERARRGSAGTTRRESAHVEALAAAIGSIDADRALGLCREHLVEFPRDALVLSQAVFLTSFGGGPRPKEDTFALFESVAAAYGDDWWFIGAWSFAHHELGWFGPAWPLAERSLTLHPRNGGAVHSLTHLYYETDDHAGGVSFLKEWLAGYDRKAPYHTHFNWHLALHHLALDQPDAAMAVYDQQVSPSASDATTVFVDASSLLWRMKLYDCEVGALPWAELSQFTARACADVGFAFVDVHQSLAHAGTADHEALGSLIEAVEALVGTGHPTAESVVLPIVRGLAAFAAEDYGAATLMAPAVAKVVRIGGTHAQREVFEDTLIVAYLRAGRGADAEALLRRRLDRRSSGRDQGWLKAARVASRVPDVVAGADSSRQPSSSPGGPGRASRQG